MFVFLKFLTFSGGQQISRVKVTRKHNLGTWKREREATDVRPAEFVVGNDDDDEFEEPGR